MDMVRSDLLPAERGTLSFISERVNFGTWERSSASDCASECASASGRPTQHSVF